MSKSIGSVRERALKVSKMKSSRSTYVSIQRDRPVTFQDLIITISQLDENDDGIKRNQKYRAIMEDWKSCASTMPDLEVTLQAISARCFKDKVFASLFTGMLCSRSFTDEVICGEKLRPLILNKIQTILELGKELQIEDPNAYRIGVDMISNIFKTARESDGGQLTYLAKHLITHLHLLLNSAEPEDIETFTAAVAENGFAISAIHRGELQCLFHRVRRMLLLEKKLTERCKVNLLLTIDMSAISFKKLPADVFSFYHEKLKTVSI